MVIAKLAVHHGKTHCAHLKNVSVKGAVAKARVLCVQKHQLGLKGADLSLLEVDRVVVHRKYDVCLRDAIGCIALVAIGRAQASNIHTHESGARVVGRGIAAEE